MKYILMIICSWNVASLYADCTRTDRTHNDNNIVRCSYTQEDIYNCFSQKATCYPCEQRRKECFYCKCPISEHSKQEVPEKCTKFGCRKGPFDDEIIERRRQKNKQRR